MFKGWRERLRRKVGGWFPQDGGVGIASGAMDENAGLPSKRLLQNAPNPGGFTIEFLKLQALDNNFRV